MNQKKIAIIDDEEDARRIIVKYLERTFPNCEIVGEASSVLSGLELLNQNEVDLLFLDINLGDGTGFDLLDNLSNFSGAVIFTTAFDQYAVKAFRYHALDYLLKPIDPDDFIEAVKFVSDRKATISNRSVQNWMATYGQADRKLAVPTSEGMRFLILDQIVYMEADSSYCSICLADKRQIIVSKPLKFFADKLEDDKMFLRPHKSFVINISCVEEYIKEDGGMLKLNNGKLIPISRQKKEEIVREMNNFFL